MDEAELNEFVKQLPKVELHAHINGSISVPTLQKLLQIKKEKNGTVNETELDMFIEDGKVKNLDDCFAIFKLIHTLTDHPNAMYLVTYDIIHDFANDNVKYLELRSTVRGNATTGMTKEQYLQAVLKAIKDCQEEGVDIIVRFLVGLDRRDTLQSLRESIDLACTYKDKSNGAVVGLDISGDPKFGDSVEIGKLLVKAKEHGLKLAVHMAESPGLDHCTKALIEIAPDRIGHGTFIHSGSDDILNRVCASDIPIEVCLTSNMKSGTVKSIKDHHFGYWYSRNHPIILCTDDKGVFDTTLTKEYLLAAKSFNMAKEDIWNLSFKAIRNIFADESIVLHLEEKWNKIKPNLFSECML